MDADLQHGRDEAQKASLAAVEALERELQTPACRADRERLAALLAPDFEEIGASGRSGGLDEIIDLVTAGARGPDPIEMQDVTARPIRDDLVLVGWTSSRGGRRARRTSLWRRDEDGRWRLTHHQATLLP